MGWFSKPETDADRAAAQIQAQHDGADVTSAIGFGARFLGADRYAERCAREADEQRRIADEIESDGRVRGWW